MTSALQDYAMLISGMLFWGGSWVSAKILVTIAPPMTIGFFRFLFASIFFLALLQVSGIGTGNLRPNFRWLVLVGMTGIFGYGILFLTGMRFTTAAQGSIIAGFNPTMIALFAHIIHKERLNRRWKYTGFVLSFLGVLMVIGVQTLLDFNISYLIGNLIILCAMAMWGLYSSISKQVMKTLSPAEVNAGGSVVGCMVFGLFALLEEPWTLPVLNDPVFWFNIIFLGFFVTFLGFLFYLRSVNRLGATKTGGFINLVPVFGTLLSVLILHETLHWTFLVGLVLVVIGITIINARSSKEAIQIVEV
ncbi:MAG: DMT family transporter [Candidatus Thorarchaeota archaeon]